MNRSAVEAYTEKLLERLFSQYNNYNKELKIIKTQLCNSSYETLEVFINTEQHRISKINLLEKVLVSHLNGCSPLYREMAESRLQIFRNKASLLNSEMRKAVIYEMGKIRTELHSLRLPRGAKKYKQESAPVLIDIKT